jgi:hypothetical protein
MPILTSSPLGTVSNRGATFDIVVDPFDVDQMLDIVMSRLSGYNLSLGLRESAHEQFADEIRSRFANEGDSKTGAWQELSVPTQNIREALGFPREHPINVRTGEMFSFLTDSFDVMVGADSAQIDMPGSAPNAELEQKIVTAQEGRSDNPIPGYGSTPPRPVLAEPDSEDMQELLESLHGWIMLEVAGVLV